MSFPKFINKEIEEALFSAEEFGSYKKWEKDKFPKKMIFCYQSSIPLYFKRRYKGYEKIKFYKGLDILKLGDIGFIKLNGVGAPNAVMIMEELAAHGTREIISFGTAGGLSETGIFLCDKAVRDEGTSHHYLPDSIYAYPDEGLTKRLAKSLEKIGLNYKIGSTWTIDAVYRETKKEIEHYKEENIKTVEMEAAALFAAGKVRKVKVASVFAVSDVLGEKWDPQFHKMNLKKTLNKLIDVCINCLKED